MKRKIGIALLILLNLTFIYLVVMNAFLSFVLIVAPLGRDKALEVAKDITNEIICQSMLLSILVLIINYLVTQKMIGHRKPFLLSFVITMIGIVVFIPFLLGARQSFLNYQKGTSPIQEMLE